MMRRFLAAAAALLLLGSAAQAQNTRGQLLQQATAAYDNFETARALDLARAALDPALGAPDSAWTRSLHLLAQVLFENGSEPDARTWARWGMRLNPRMTIDSVNFLAGVVGILRQARTDAGTRSASDDLTRMTWQWPARGSTATQGTLRLDPSPMSVPLNVTVSNTNGTPVGQLLAGPGLTLAPGTYDVQVSASGFLPARVTREVLPGVTLTVSFQLTSAAILSGTITDVARQAVYRNTAALSISRFGSAAPSCAAGVAVGSRFLLTSYSAVRGADSLTLTIGGNPVPGAIRVAAWDATADLAVLLLPTARADSVLLSAQIVDGQGVWGVGLAQCRTLSDARTTIDEWTQRPLGSLRLADAVANGVIGAPVVDFQGRLAGIWTAGTGAVAGPNAAALIAQARAAVTANTTATVAEMSRRENHSYGSITVTTDVAGATVRLVGAERWHWAPLSSMGATGTSPFTFSGPMGKYRLETSAPGLQTRTQEVTLRPGEVVRVMVPLRTVAQTPAGGGAPPAAKKGISKWVWVAVIGGGAAAAAALGGGGGGGGSSTGGINITVPNP